MLAIEAMAPRAASAGSTAVNGSGASRVSPSRPAGRLTGFFSSRFAARRPLPSKNQDSHPPPRRLILRYSRPPRSHPRRSRGLRRRYVATMSGRMRGAPCRPEGGGRLVPLRGRLRLPPPRRRGLGCAVRGSQSEHGTPGPVHGHRNTRPAASAPRCAQLAPAPSLLGGWAEPRHGQTERGQVLCAFGSWKYLRSARTQYEFSPPSLLYLSRSNPMPLPATPALTVDCVAFDRSGPRAAHPPRETSPSRALTRCPAASSRSARRWRTRAAVS